MIFDTLITLAERHMPPLLPLLDRARLFKFDYRAYEVLAKSYDDEELEWMQENFFLPFPTVAVEDGASCVVLWRDDKEERGLYGSAWRFLECMPLDAPVEEFREANGDEAEKWKELIEAQTSQLPKGACGVTLGDIAFTKVTARSWEARTHVEWTSFMERSRVIMSPAHGRAIVDSDPEAGRTAAINAKTAIEEVLYFNNPSRFVVESIPKRALRRQQKGGKRKRVARSHDRPQYILLTPKEIREKLRLPLPVGKVGRGAHERRAHTRTFRHPRYTEMRGKSIVVPATWVGPSEATVGKRRYKVMLKL